MIGWFLSAVYFLSGAFLCFQAWVHWRLMRAPQPPKSDRAPRADPSPWPPVVVQLPLYNEPAVVERLLDAVWALRVPAPLTVQILDDSTDATTDLIQAWLARRNHPPHMHLLHRTHRQGYKAGALQAGLEHVPDGAVVAIFDADFVPAPDALARALPRLLSIPTRGALQLRWDHLNAQSSALTRVQALNLDAHFAVEQEGRARLGVWNSFNGTAGLWRKEAIVSAGGWSHDTLAEDLDLSIRMQLAGWELAYADDLGVPAELPDDTAAYLTQQRRWTQGGSACAAKHLADVRSKLPRGPVRFHATAQLLASSIHLPVWLMTTSSVPLLVQATMEDGAVWPLRFGGVFLFTMGMFVALYWTAARRRHNTRRFPLHMLTMFALGAGTTFHNAKAAWAGWRQRQAAEFVRTPKRGEAQLTTAGWRLTQSKAGVGEWLHAAWFAAGIGWGGHAGEWGLVPFHLLLFAGYFWVAASLTFSPSRQCA